MVCFHPFYRTPEEEWLESEGCQVIAADLIAELGQESKVDARNLTLSPQP